MFVCAVILVLIVTVNSENAYEALGNNPELLEFQKMVNQDEVLRAAIQNWEVTVYAPTSKAIASHEEQIKGRESRIAAYHVINLLVNQTMFPFTTPSSFGGGGTPPLYMTVREPSDHSADKEYFVNNAKILSTRTYVSRTGQNQIVCVIDEVLLPYLPRSALPPTALELLRKPENIPTPLSSFKKKIEEEMELGNLLKEEGHHTFFIPVDTQAPEQAIDSWVIRSHVIPDTVLFTRPAGQKRYVSAASGADIQVEVSFIEEDVDDGLTNMYVQSNTMRSDHGHKKGAVLAEIVQANIPVRNGVVHLIKHPLMVIDTTVWEMLQDEIFSEFMKLVNNSAEFKELLMRSSQKTVLVPSNDAIHHLKEETLNFIERNITNFLKLHLVMLSVSTDDVPRHGLTEFPSSDNSSTLYFHVLEDNQTLAVEGGNVKAVAVQSDIGAVDGMIHILDRFLGIPYETVYQRLQSIPHLRITNELGQQDDWGLTTLSNMNKNFTFFAPSNEAWAKVQTEMPTAYKQITMGIFPYHVHKILERHLIVGRELSFEELEQLQELQMVHGKFKVQPASSSGENPFSSEGQGGIILEWDGIEAQIIRADVQAINGVIHIIDNVMMKKRDLTKAAAASHTKTSLLWTASIVVLCLWKCLLTG